MIILLTFVISTTLTAQSISAKEKKYTGWGANNLTYNKQALITGDKNTYGFNLCFRKPNKNKETTLYMVLTEPRRQGGFGQHSCRFLSMNVNGIPLSQLVPNEKTFRLWTKKDSAGAQVLFNFDGAGILFDVFMVKGSPMLWLKFRPDTDQKQPIAKCSIQFQVQISGVNGGKKVKNTFAKTATRELSGREWKNSLNLLSGEDRWLILGDKILDGSGGKDKGFGPSFILLPNDFSQVKKMELRLMNQPLSLLNIDLKPDFTELTIGIWQNQGAISNDDFMKLFENNKKSFTTIND